MQGSDFIFDSVHLLLLKCQKIKLNSGGSYIHYLDWIKNKKALIELINDDEKWFQYAVIGALNHKEIAKILTEYQKLSFL